MNSLEKITMPKCCISCDHYSHKGRMNDKFNPCAGIYGANPRSKFGRCNENNADVFADQVCDSFKIDLSLVDVVEVPSVNRVLEPMQTRLI